MNKIIVLYGAASIGKSTVLRLVHSELKMMSSGWIDGMQKKGVDLRDVFIIKGRKVGIETEGDPGGRLEKSLSEFRREGCEIIVCASRTRGGTVEIVERMKPNYHLSWRGQSNVSDLGQRKLSNCAICELIINEVRHALHA